MNHKTFVFFDCECANVFDGVGKICSLGYVITDDELNVIESEDVVMNPECEFDWYLFGAKSECKLAYSKDYFRIKPNWAAYYKDIKKSSARLILSMIQVDLQVQFLQLKAQIFHLCFSSINVMFLEFLHSLMSLQLA